MIPEITTGTQSLNFVPAEVVAIASLFCVSLLDNVSPVLVHIPRVQLTKNVFHIVNSVSISTLTYHIQLQGH